MQVIMSIAMPDQACTLLQVEIISVDKSYSTDRTVMDPNYSPKVSTWGVFERPANISEAYGGGRTIKAGTPLEDPAATQARKERIAAALSRLVTTCTSTLGLPTTGSGPLLKFRHVTGQPCWLA